ncbi:MAG: hemopexin repeat-containing protein [Candidatus Hodarchaeota archaeon]
MSNERMINSVSVGIVYVSSPGDFAISDVERAHILAEIQEGLNALAALEPRAKLSWVYSTLNVILPNFTPWEGAKWPGLTEDFYRSMDAALGSNTNKKIYFFRGNEYIRVDPYNSWEADPNYPKPIAGNWPGFPTDFANGVDAALWSEKNQKIYFFKDDQYIRVDPYNGFNVDPNYPKPIAGNWPGFPTDFANGVDAALWSEKNQKIYFFKDDQYIRVDPYNGFNVDPNYPKPIAGNWPGFPTDFANGVDAALWSEKNQKIYFFKKNRFYNQYIRVDPYNGFNVDPDYPKPVGLGWEAEQKWRDPALTQLGFPTGGDGITQLTQFFQDATSAQYGYIVFFTKMPTAWFAYAGGLRVVMRRVSGSFDTWTSIDSVFAHETGHIFGAPDEYASSNCVCDSIHGRFIRKENGNCVNCCPTPVSCLMWFNTLSNLCDYTPAHIGWEAFLDKIDGGLFSFKNNKLYMFSEKYYVRYSSGFVMDDNYPKPIAGNWPGFPTDFANGVDAALWSEKNQKIYFFKDDQYIRVDPYNGFNVDPNYPKPIAGNWPGFPTDFANGVDAALWSEKNQKIYFFKDDQYIRVDPYNGFNVDPNYPKPIAGNWPGFPTDFANGVDSVEWSEFNKKIYFFKGTRYIRVNPYNNWNIDVNYPKDININWRMPFPIA